MELSEARAVELGLLRGVEIDDAEARVRIRMTFTTPACPLAPEILKAMRDELIEVEEIRADFGIWT